MSRTRVAVFSWKWKNSLDLLTQKSKAHMRLAQQEKYVPRFVQSFLVVANILGKLEQLNLSEFLQLGLQFLFQLLFPLAIVYPRFWCRYTADWCRFGSSIPPLGICLKNTASNRSRSKDTGP